MKVKSSCIALCVLLFMLTTTVTAYSTDNFSIEINEEYEVQEEEGQVMFRNKETKDNILVQEIEQKVIGGKLTSYQLKSITSEITNQYKDLYDADVEEIGKKEVTINGRKVTKMNFKATLMGTDIYQELNIFVSKDKIYDIIFTSTSEKGFSEEEKSSILNSFTILNETSNSVEYENNEASFDIRLVVIGMAIIILIAATIIIRLIRKSKKDEQY